MPIHTHKHLKHNHLRSHDSHPTPSTSHQSHPGKPNTSATTRLLILLLQALVMSAAITLFFIFAGIATLILIHLFIPGRSIRRLRRHRYHHHTSPSDDRPCRDGPTPGLSPWQLKTIPISKFTTSTNNKIATTLRWCSDCAVCLEGFREGDRYRTMPTCNHAFHKTCADNWLLRSAACPICRADVCSVS